jgi:hypothetical protein
VYVEASRTACAELVKRFDKSPTSFGTQLNTTWRNDALRKQAELARPERLERPTYWFEAN